MDRSILYNLEPMGFGTPYVESLTSYITRIADAHCILTGTLISRIYAPYLKKDYLTKISVRGGGFYETAIGINGMGQLAYEFSQLTNKLTGRLDISNTTLEKWTAILPTRGLLKKTKSWCPQCYEEAKLNGEIIYDQLIWNFQLVNYCLKHKTPLVNECANCKSLIHVIDRESLPGFCPRCGKWLGLKNCHSDNVERNNVSFSHISLIGELLENNQLNLSHASLVESLNFYVNEAFSQTPLKAATYFNIPKTTFRTWISGKARPNINYLTQMCQMLGISIIEFLQKQTSNKKNGTIERAVKVRVVFDHPEIKKTLKKLIESKEPVSISEVSRRIGCDRKLLSRMYETECEQIKENYNEFLQDKKEERLARKINLLKEAFNSIVKQGVYPSRRQLEALLGAGFLKEKVLQEKWNKLKKEMNVDEI